jgi:hypothetical protein
MFQIRAAFDSMYRVSDSDVFGATVSQCLDKFYTTLFSSVSCMTCPGLARTRPEVNIRG